MKKYKEFLESKVLKTESVGMDIDRNSINPKLFDFQKDIVKWAVKKGRCALFEDCGLGKTPQQLEWAHKIGERTLILAPLAVNTQTVSEGFKFNIIVNPVESMDEVKDGINITNYEKLHKFDLSKFGALVLDESSILKSFDGKYRNEIINMSSAVKYKLACTATPSPNDFMELGNHSEFLGVMKRTEMLANFFVHDGGDTAKWRLKNYAKSQFWEWVCSWSVYLRNPSEIGYDGSKFILPKLKREIIYVDSKISNSDYLFNLPAVTLEERRLAKKNSIDDRVNESLKHINKKQTLIWCNFNDESEKLKNIIPNSIEVKGSDMDEHKSESMIGFSKGEIRNLITKPKIAGFGMNWQNCNQMIFVGLSDSFEQYYQAIRRCWRFGQKNEVSVKIIISKDEQLILDNIERKEEDYNMMAEEMAKNTKNILNQTLHNRKEEKDDYKIDIKITDKYQLILGDSIEEIKKIESESIGYSIFSPPFAELYTYSDSIRDMGNSKNYDQFFIHFDFLVSELFRIVQSGRLVSVHCVDIPAMKERDGFIGLKDFPGEIIRLFQKHGFIYHSRHIIWKDPLIEATRTKSLGLMHKQIMKDSAMCRAGLPDYLLTFRKKGENNNPLNHDNGFESFIGEHEPKENGIKYSHLTWQKYASPVWMDIRQSRTLNRASARSDNDEKHICPLQLDVIDRGLELWSKEGDIVFSPFAGIGSEGYVSILKGRKFIGIELKEEYWKNAIKNLESACNEHGNELLFKEEVAV